MNTSLWVRRATLIAALAAASLASGTAGATPYTTYMLTFDGAICDGGVACTNSSLIDQTYGDVPGVIDVVYDRNVGLDTSGSDAARLRFWATGYSDLTNVAWGGTSDTAGTAEIFLDPAPGYRVQLNSFDLGAWPAASPGTMPGTIDTAFSILDGSSNLYFSSGSLAISKGPHESFVFGHLANDSGFRIQWGPSAYDVGIDNLTFTVDSTTVPEPATIALFGLGLAGLGFSLRRKRA